MKNAIGAGGCCARARVTRASMVSGNIPAPIAFFICPPPTVRFDWQAERSIRATYRRGPSLAAGRLPGAKRGAAVQRLPELVSSWGSGRGGGLLLPWPRHGTGKDAIARGRPVSLTLLSARGRLSPPVRQRTREAFGVLPRGVTIGDFRAHWAERAA